MTFFAFTALAFAAALAALASGNPVPTPKAPALDGTVEEEPAVPFTVKTADGQWMPNFESGPVVQIHHGHCTDVLDRPADDTPMAIAHQKHCAHDLGIAETKAAMTASQCEAALGVPDDGAAIAATTGSAVAGSPRRHLNFIEFDYCAGFICFDYDESAKGIGGTPTTPSEMASDNFGRLLMRQHLDNLTTADALYLRNNVYSDRSMALRRTASACSPASDGNGPKRAAPTKSMITVQCTTDETGGDGCRHDCASAPSVFNAQTGSVIVAPNMAVTETSGNGDHHYSDCSFANFVESPAMPGVYWPTTITMAAHATSPSGHWSGRGWETAVFTIPTTPLANLTKVAQQNMACPRT